MAPAIYEGSLTEEERISFGSFPIIMVPSLPESSTTRSEDEPQSLPEEEDRSVEESLELGEVFQAGE